MISPSTLFLQGKEVLFEQKLIGKFQIFLSQNCPYTQWNNIPNISPLVAPKFPCQYASS